MLIFRQRKGLRSLLTVLLVVALSAALLVGCGRSGGNGGGGGGDVSGYEWLLADATLPPLDPVTVRGNGPEDWRDEIIYFVMTDRFKDGDKSNNPPSPFYNKSSDTAYHGGDLQGLRDEVDYLRRLGVTAVWITPPVENNICDHTAPQYTNYHGYGARDVRKVDPSLVSNTTNDGFDDFKAFVDHMHNNGLLVIQDVVVNHMGEITVYPRQSDLWGPPFNSSGYPAAFVSDYFSGQSWVATERVMKPSPPFDNINFFHNCGPIAGAWDDPVQGVKGDFYNKRDLKTTDPDVRKALIQAYGKWVETGVDGFRLDTVKHVEEDFWDEFSPAIRNYAGEKKFLQFGEVWKGAHSDLYRYTQGERLDSVLNYVLYFRIKDVFIGGGSTSALTDELAGRENGGYRTAGIAGGGAELGANEVIVNFIDNHDNRRFLTEAGGSLPKLYNALCYLMTTKGIPCIYYNTENDTTGSSGDAGRKDMVFAPTNNKTFTLIRVLAKLRREHVALRRGDMSVLKDSASANSHAKFFAFVRHTGVSAENVFVFVNASDQQITQEVDLGGYAQNGDVIRNILYAEFNQEESLTVTNGKVTVTLPPHNTKIFKL